MSKKISRFEYDRKVLSNDIHDSDAEQFLEEMPTLSDLESRDLQKETGNRQAKILPFKIVKGVAAILVISVLLTISHRPSNDLAIRMKGESVISLVMKRQSTLSSVKGDTLSIEYGDTLQFLIHSDTPLYYALWADSTGNHPVLLTGNTLDRAGNSNGEPVANTIITDSSSHGYTIHCVASKDSLALLDMKSINDSDSNITVRRVFLK